jgi:RND superfamily putative drug exporter
VFVRIARWCTTHRGLTFGAWVLALVLAWVLGSSLGTQKISNFRLPGTESQKAYDVLAEHAPSRNGIVDQFVFVAREGTLREGAASAGMRTALERLKSDSDVVAVSDPRRSGQLTKDGRTGVALVTYKSGAEDFDVERFKRVEKAGFSVRGRELQVEHGGPGAEVVRQAAGQGYSTEIFGLLAAAIVLMITFGSMIAAGVPLLNAILALGTTLGLVPVISQIVDTPDFAPQLAGLIGLGVGIDYALIVVTRYRAEHARGLSRDEALLLSIDTAGRTVFFAGLTVIIALLGLLLLGLSFMQGAALASALAVALVMSASLTLLPAMLSKLGNWIDRGRLGIPGRRRREQAPAQPAALSGESPAWARWSETIQGHPWAAIAGALIVLLALAAPALHMRLGSSDAGVDPPGTTTRIAYDLIADGFGAGTNGQFLIVADLARKGDVASARRLARAVASDPDAAVVAPPQLSPDGEVATILMFPRTGPQDEATTELLDRLRNDTIPAVERAGGAQVYVGGQTASQEDFTSVIADKLPLFVGTVVLLSALLLMAVFRSVFVPVKAALMNLLSISAALGVVTVVFQDGFLADALGIGTGPVESFVPVMLFAIVFGLSMDYEVFLMSRMHEEWHRTGDASLAVRNGVATTGRVITAAAAIMIVVFASFGLLPDRVIKEFGLGLAVAVLIDAVVIRCLLVPAIMQLAGRAAWWLPSWLGWIPRLALERS